MTGMINYKGFGRRWLWSHSDVILALLGGTKKDHKKPGIPVDI